MQESPSLTAEAAELLVISRLAAMNGRSPADGDTDNMTFQEPPSNLFAPTLLCHAVSLSPKLAIHITY